MGTLDGKTAFITGAARGQGRAHAVMLASEGADIVAVDVCAEVTPVEYPAADPGDLAETVRQVEALGRRIVARIADVRDSDALVAAAVEGAAALGGIDVVVANAGVVNWGRLWEMPDEQWRDVIDINLTGVFKTLKATVPLMIEQGTGGSIVITSSAAGLKALPGQLHYSASKHALVGLMRSAAIELAPHGIRVNTVHPWAVDTPMGGVTETLQRFLTESPTYARSFHQLIEDPPILGAQDIAAAVLYLVSPAARGITGASLPVDSGNTVI